MGLLHGKQIKDTTISLNKLSGAGDVDIASGASIDFLTGSTLTYADAPSTGTEVANKAYVDSVATGLEVKESARAISTSEITLSGTQQIDGVDVIAGDRVVVNGQADASENGIYVVDTGAWTRAIDMDEPSEVNGGEFVFITEGNTYADTGWVVSTPDSIITIGTGDINFTQFSSAGVVTGGTGLTRNGNVIDLDNTAVTTGSFGSATQTSTFTVDQQGRLTAAGQTTISIPSTQINDFATAVEGVVFTTANFTNGSTIDFTVTAGDKLTAEVDLQTVAGEGLGVSGNSLTVNAENGLNVDTDSVKLGGSLTENTTITTDEFTLEFQDDRETKVGIQYKDNGYVTTDTSLTDKKYVDDLVSNSISSATLTGGDGIDITGGAVSVDLVTNSGLTFNGDKLTVNSSIAGDGLGFSNGVITVGAGNGIAVDSDNVIVDLATNSALEFVSGKLSVNDSIAGTGLTWTNGVLSVSAGAATPVYQKTNPAASAGDDTTGADTGITLTSTPNDFSRIEVYVNGQKQRLQVTSGTHTGFDCWFGDENNASDLADLTSGASLFWNSESAEFALEEGDVVEITYEA